MTFDDDYARIHPSIDERSRTYRMKDLGIEWPPPAHMEIWLPVEMTTLEVTRVLMSEITDEQRSEMSHVARGCLYVEDPKTWDGRT